MVIFHLSHLSLVAHPEGERPPCRKLNPRCAEDTKAATFGDPAVAVDVNRATLQLVRYLFFMSGVTLDLLVVHSPAYATTGQIELCPCTAR